MAPSASDTISSLYAFPVSASFYIVVKIQMAKRSCDNLDSKKCIQ